MSYKTKGCEYGNKSITIFFGDCQRRKYHKCCQLVTQPTLSRQIKELEDELKQKLFIRGSHSMTLTKEGLIFRKRQEKIISMVDKTEEKFKSMENALSGDVYMKW